MRCIPTIVIPNITMRTYSIVPVLRRIPTITIITININLLLSMIPSDGCLFIIFLIYLYYYYCCCCALFMLLFVCLFVLVFHCFCCLNVVYQVKVLYQVLVYLVPTFTSLFVKPRASVIVNSFGLWFVFLFCYY